MVGATTAANQATAHRLSVLSGAGCIPCMIDGWWEPAEIHHVLNGQYRHADEHRHTYPACAWHHRGVPPIDVYFDFGPSMAVAPRDYRDRYGSEEQLVQIADAIVRIVDAAARRHEWLPERKLVVLVGELYQEIVHHSPPKSYRKYC